jgi:hypothetical protein
MKHANKINEESSEVSNKKNENNPIIVLGNDDIESDKKIQRKMQKKVLELEVIVIF